MPNEKNMLGCKGLDTWWSVLGAVKTLYLYLREIKIIILSRSRYTIANLSIVVLSTVCLVDRYQDVIGFFTHLQHKSHTVNEYDSPHCASIISVTPSPRIKDEDL